MFFLSIWRHNLFLIIKKNYWFWQSIPQINLLDERIKKHVYFLYSNLCDRKSFFDKSGNYKKNYIICDIII